MANLFGTLNRFISRLDGDPTVRTSSPSQYPKHGDSNSNSGAYGFQVLRNTSPSTPLEPWFDYIIGLNGHNIDDPSPHLFSAELNNAQPGSSVSLGVWTAKGGRLKEIYVSVKDAEGLGLTVQWAPLTATEDVYHILSVAANSPAEHAGLLPYSDYIVGSPEGLLHGEAGLGELVNDFLNRELRLWVYNHEYDVVREVRITPRRDWGGEGKMGCELGFGALHKIPAPLSEPVEEPGQTLFDTEGSAKGRFEHEDDTAAERTASTGQPTSRGDFFVPANMTLNLPPPSAPAPPPPGPLTSESQSRVQSPDPASPPSATTNISSSTPATTSRTRKQRPQRATNPLAGMDDYFAEGEQKSREQDRAPTPRAGTPLPPPPKTGAQRSTSSPPPMAAEQREQRLDGEGRAQIGEE